MRHSKSSHIVSEPVTRASTGPEMQMRLILPRPFPCWHPHDAVSHVPRCGQGANRREARRKSPRLRLGGRVAPQTGHAVCDAHVSHPSQPARHLADSAQNARARALPRDERMPAELRGRGYRVSPLSPPLASCDPAPVADMTDQARPQAHVRTACARRSHPAHPPSADQAHPLTRVRHVRSPSQSPARVLVFPRGLCSGSGDAHT